MGGGSATGCAGPSGAFPGQPTHRARGQAAAWARWPSDAAGGVCGLVRAGSASAVAPLPLCASPVQAGELKRRSRHTEYAVELATLRETGRRRAKVAQGLLVLLLQEGQFAQMVDVAEGMTARGVATIRRPPVMHTHPGEARQDADGVGRFCAAFGRTG